MLTIIIPVYNEINTIEKILDKIDKVDFISKEIILVDDASTDGTKTLIEKKLKKKAIFYIKKSKKYQWNLNFKKNVIYFRKAKINFHNKYLINAINKYYK